MAAVLLGVVAALSWSVHDLIARSFAIRIGPVRMAIAVMILGGLLMTFLIIYRGTIWQATASGILQSLLLGVAYGMGVGGLFKAFSLGPISLVGPITAAYPALVVLWGVANGLSPSALQWAAIAVTLMGAVLVARSGHENGGINAVARKNVLPLLFFCLLCSIGYAASVVIGQKAAVTIGEYEATWISRATAALVLVPFVVGEAKPVSLAPRHWWGIATMAILDMAGLTAINASGFLPEHDFAAIGISTYGASAVILAALVLKEKVSPGQWAGIGLIVSGVAVISIARY